MQTLLQLLLIPQGTLSGQIAFLFSFVISWLYNLYLSSLDKEKIQQELLFKTLNVKCTTKFQLGTRTTAAVFATLVLRPFSPIELQPFSPILGYFLPNETVVWKRWREHVGKHIETINWTRDTDEEVVDASGRSYKEYDATLAGLSVKDERLLRKLLDDAWDGFEGYCTFLNLKHPGKLV
ncbi:hypothetical protein M405DRAFT_811452 [Rhizopogon salebrosus TDB-379]|nr:hypothetical protein M405DRAFT_811452 [Rhizopogon salebrosus TDB-379]